MADDRQSTERVAIVTLTGDSNYGNRLQNYALQETLKELTGCRVDTIHSNPRTGDGHPIARRLSRIRSEGPAPVLGWIRRRLRLDDGINPADTTRQLDPEQNAAIAAFVRDYLSDTPLDYSDPGSDSALTNSYTFFVAGSDQIWNPTMGLRDHLRFLQFARPEQRVAYSASIGIPTLPNYLHKAYRAGVGAMASVSVREDQAARTIEALIGRKVPVTLDPTMLLGAPRWEALAAPPPSLSSGGYVAHFFLGGQDSPQLQFVHQYARRHGLREVDLNAPTDPELRTMGPLEFIGALQQAALVVTDSFHAAVFSILFEVPFLLRGRGQMNSRFETLLGKAGLDHPKWDSYHQLEASLKINWEEVSANLSRERAASLDYLRRAVAPNAG